MSMSRQSTLPALTPVSVPPGLRNHPRTWPELSWLGVMLPPTCTPTPLSLDSARGSRIGSRSKDPGQKSTIRRSQPVCVYNSCIFLNDFVYSTTYRFKSLLEEKKWVRIGILCADRSLLFKNWCFSRHELNAIYQAKNMYSI